MRNLFIPRLTTTLLALTAALCGAAAQAGTAYVQAGLPGVGLGYAQPWSDVVNLRADYMTLGSHTQNGQQEGIDYQGQVKLSRLGLFADYFPMGNGFRVTGGMTLNDATFKLRSHFVDGGTVTVGGATALVSSADYFNVDVKFPKATPYLGMGWGLNPGGQGWGLIGDVGVSLGRATVAIDTNLTSRGVSQADIDKETQSLRDGVGKIRMLPQATLGVSYRY